MAGEKSVLSEENIKSSYYGLCFSANVACFGKNWISQFINSVQKPFFIDPVTYVAQFNPDLTKKFKEKIEKMGTEKMVGEKIEEDQQKLMKEKLKSLGYFD